MSAQENQLRWARLFRVATDLIRQVNSETPIIDHWTLGGGTALMLQIDHRESRDVDIFLQDPQLLSFLDPQKKDFKLEIQPTQHDGDGSKFLKFAFEGIGEIDFIVSQHLTEEPAIEREIERETTLLETITEVIAKKVVFRGSGIKPRDIFDIAAAGEQHADSIISALRPHRPAVMTAVKTLEKLNPEFVRNAMSQLLIREKFRGVASTAMERVKEILWAV